VCVCVCVCVCERERETLPSYGCFEWPSNIKPHGCTIKRKEISKNSLANKGSMYSIEYLHLLTLLHQGLA